MIVLFIDIKKAYDSVPRNEIYVPCNIIKVF